MNKDPYSDDIIQRVNILGKKLINEMKMDGLKSKMGSFFIADNPDNSLFAYEKTGKLPVGSKDTRKVYVNITDIEGRFYFQISLSHGIITDDEALQVFGGLPDNYDELVREAKAWNQQVNGD